MAVKHAVLSASSSERWLNCPPSARLCEAYEDKGSDYAAEGTDAHSLCEFRLKQALGIPADDPIENLSWYNEEMEDCAAGYAAYVSELLETAKQTCADPVVMIEQRVDFSRWVKEGFGTADCIIIADGVLNICDYKNGQGCLVLAERNPQMMLYALGALEIFDGIYDIDTVRMTIYQPRKSNISVYEMDKADLYEWANSELTQKAQLAYEGQGSFSCGEWCRFCKARYTCRKRSEYHMRLAECDFKQPDLLTDEEILDILPVAESLNSWVQDLISYATQQAVNGKDWPGYKLVAGRSVRRYTSEAEAIKAATEAGFTDIYKTTLLSVGDLEKRMGRKKFSEVLGKYVVKPVGAPQLVPESDPRKPYSDAASDFAQ